MKYLIVGLGNPGDRYKDTRHNIGANVVEAFRTEHNFSEWQYSKYADALYSRSMIGESEVELLLPQTFMNLSGKSVEYAATKHGLNLENIIIVHDDLDLAVGLLRIAFARGTGGHNGVESVTKHLGTKDFTRLRFGIAPTNRPKGEEAVVKFVLKKFSIFRERGAVKETTTRAVNALTALVERGRESAMNEVN